MCDWPTARGAPCELSSQPFGWLGLDLCTKHAGKLARSVISELEHNAFAEPHCYGPQVMGALFRYTQRHPAEEFWEWIRTMEGCRLAKQERAPTWVYFAERERLVKIGWSGNVEQRLAALAAGGQMVAGMTAGPLRLLATVPGGAPEEHDLHRRFSHLRVDPRREWFRLEGDLAQFLASLDT